MHANLKLFQTAGALAAHAGHRQAVLAQNVANADTPGYRARDVPDFAVLYRSNGAAASGMQATRAGHLHGSVAGRSGMLPEPVPVDRDGDADPSGNTVSVERELMLAVDSRRQHDKALAVYKSGLDLLRLSLRVR